MIPFFCKISVLHEKGISKMSCLCLDYLTSPFGPPNSPWWALAVSHEDSYTEYRLKNGLDLDSNCRFVHS